MTVTVTRYRATVTIVLTLVTSIISVFAAKTRPFAGGVFLGASLVLNLVAASTRAYLDSVAAPSEPLDDPTRFDRFGRPIVAAPKLTVLDGEKDDG